MMKFKIENAYEVQEELIKNGYTVVAPKDGTYTKKEVAVEKASDYDDSVVVCHTYNGSYRGYMVFARLKH